MLNETIQIFAHGFGWGKTLIIGFISTVSGWLASKVVVAAQVAPQPVETTWYNSPVVWAAIVAAVVGIILKLLERRWTTVDKKKDREKELHEREIQFWKERDKLKSLEAFEARARAHRFGNEVNRLYGHIFILHKLTNDAGLEIPEIQLKSYDELMDGISFEIEDFKKTLAEQLDEVIHRTTEK